jgi:lycopene beta-cyclase
MNFSQPEQHFDYIIAGGGMAGLSLAFYINQSEKLRHKKILIIDQAPKTENDRTWCFWERGEKNPFESVIFRKWQQLDFFGENFSKRFVLKDYFYKMLRGIDFYQFVYKQIETNPNITFAYQAIQAIENTRTGAKVITEQATYTADFVFDSVFKPDFQAASAHALLQHFKGWVIDVPKPVFDTDCITLQDFRIEQNGDEARFFYVLPLSQTQALVEFTLFSPAILTPQAYDEALKAYIKNYLQITDYQIHETEFGIIPMSDVSIENRLENIVRIGKSGGYVRASTGYTFARTQRFLQKIVQNLETNGKPDLKTPWFEQRFELYDSVMLHVLTQKKYSGAAFFSRLYQRNPIERIFDFLDEKSSFTDELKLMSTTPLLIFSRAAFAEIARKWRA